MLEVNLEPIIKDRNITKKGFKNSIGWNLGTIEKSIHHFDPFTSAPNNGTNNKDTKKITNKIAAILYTSFSLMNENTIIKVKPINIKIKCLKKK